MRLITASFARGLARCTDHLWMQFLIVSQQVGAISKTCNQLKMKNLERLILMRPFQYVRSV